jgi:uncharacterized protein (DUF2235 family)
MGDVYRARDPRLGRCGGTWRSPMSKRIVFCADGTWDTATNHTNVYLLYNALTVGADQLPFYDDGVGADGNPIEKLTGGAFGFGLFQKIKDGYTKIAHAYDEGDEIFVFGFSRGAYTARSLAGFIAVAGLPTRGFDSSLVDTAFDAYRDKDERDGLLASLAPYGMVDAKLTMVGVWDTVGSLGIPAMFGAVDQVLYGFLDTTLHPDVLNAYQALAIDERRAEFPPTLWTSAPTPGQTLQQLWFAGDHSDVGGSHEETGLSDIALGWMMGKARTLGLQMADAAWAKYGSIAAQHALDTIHDSWSVLWGFPKHRSIAPGSAVANSVEIRCLHDSSYQPSNLVLANREPTGYQIIPVVEPAPA